MYPEKELLLVCDRGNKRISMWDKLGNPVDTIPLPQVRSKSGPGVKSLDSNFD